ncbi:MAG: hypothetical protein ACKESB_02720 [Candidatus Hodgkinia cicadicola]
MDSRFEHFAGFDNGTHWIVPLTAALVISLINNTIVSLLPLRPNWRPPLECGVSSVTLQPLAVLHLYKWVSWRQLSSAAWFCRGRP